MFLLYRSSIALQYRGAPTKDSIREFAKQALIFHQIAQEEIFVNDLLKAGDKLLLENKYDEAIKMFEEAFCFDKWKEVYGGTILTNLAYAQALKGNMVMAKHFN
jgi:tetratricopeptide (TPR) repeat protein